MISSDILNPLHNGFDNWQGTLQLEFSDREGSTQISHQQVKAPLKVQRPFYPEGAAVCHSVILHTAGGMVGGDRLDLDLGLQPQAHALVTTAAASKIYRSNGQEARQTVQIRVSENACLEWFPQEAIVFNRAQYRQDLRVELAKNALWMGWDMTRFGRSARGEQFVEGNWRSRTEVWRDGVPLWIDSQGLPGSEELWHSPHGLAGQPVVGSFALVGRSVSPEVIDAARAVWQPQSSASQVGVTSLMEGLLCRYRGPSTTEARRWFMQVWQVVRQTYLGRNACPPRVWQI